MNIDMLAAAIKNGDVLSVHYGGGWRLVEPHTLGRGSKGQFLLRAFQISGYSRSGEATGWKLFSVGELVSAVPTAAKFTGPRPGYNPSDSVMRGGIIATF